METSGSVHLLSRAVIIDNNQILLSRSRNKMKVLFPDSAEKKEAFYYYLPGWHLEKNESIRAALIRELLEETTFDFTIDRFLGCYEYSFPPTSGAPMCHNHEYNFVFLAHSNVMKAGMLPHDPSLAAELEWVPYASLSKLPFFYPEQMASLIQEWLATYYDRAFQSSMKP
jgi:8-oxo-dGTP diphosphatase